MSKVRNFLTDEQKAQIRGLYVDGGYTCKEIGEMFGVGEKQVWRNVTLMKLTELECEKHNAEYRKRHQHKRGGRKVAHRVEEVKVHPHKNKLTDVQKERVNALHDHGKTFDQIARLMGIGREQCRKSYNRNAKKHENGFYASSKWCSGCMYFGKFGRTPCCDYTYLTGHAKLREGEPACTCRYKTIGKRPKVEEE